MLKIVTSTAATDIHVKGCAEGAAAASCHLLSLLSLPWLLLRLPPSLSSAQKNTLALAKVPTVSNKSKRKKRMERVERVEQVGLDLRTLASRAARLAHSSTGTQTF